MTGVQTCALPITKQKTAYEMVSCDWSSDVCSSDLDRAKSAVVRRVAQSLGGQYFEYLLELELPFSVAFDPADCAA